MSHSVSVSQTTQVDQGPQEEAGVPLQEEASVPIPEEQLLYAKILRVGSLAGLGLLLATFILYATELLPAAVPIKQLPNYWGKNVDQYLRAVNRDFLHQPGPVRDWSWVALVNKADYLNYLGIVLLSGITVFCFLGVVPVFVKKKDWIYAAMAVLEAAILTLAASGILSVKL